MIPATRLPIYTLIILLLLLALGFALDQRALVHAFDTGLYLQLLWNFWQDGSLASSVTGEHNFLAHHFQPLVLALAPLVAIWARPTMLFACAALCVLLSVLLVVRKTRPGEATTWLVSAACIGWILHPAVAHRVFYSFSPDIFVLPIYFALALNFERLAERRGRWVAMFLLVAAGLCKENFWLINIGVAVAFAVRAKSRFWWAVVAAMNAGIFVFIFKFWMPEYSQMESYYGLRFFMGDALEGEAGAWDILRAVMGNVFSGGAIASVGWLFLLLGGLGFLGWDARLIPAAFAMAFVVGSGAAQIRHPANQYLLPVIPFLVAVGLEQVRRAETTIGRAWSRRWALLVVCAPALYLFFHDNGVLKAIDKMVAHPQTAYFRSDALEFKREVLPASALLLTNGTLQPIFYDHRETIDILSFTGNPRRLSEAEFLGAFYVLSTDDLSVVEDCDALELGGQHLQADRVYFARLCRRIKSDGRELKKYERSGLVAYLVAPIAF